MTAQDRRRELAEFLRSRRARRTPAQAGLPTFGRRRTPGLRREVVATPAGVSITWYTWLEQASPDSETPSTCSAPATRSLDAASFSGSRPVTSTSAPAAVSLSAVARPIPDVPPMITTRILCASDSVGLCGACPISLGNAETASQIRLMLVIRPPTFLLGADDGTVPSGDGARCRERTCWASRRPRTWVRSPGRAWAVCGLAGPTRGRRGRRDGPGPSEPGRRGAGCRAGCRRAHRARRG